MTFFESLFHFPSIHSVIGLFLLSCVTSYALFRGVLAYFPKMGLLDNPAPYGHKRNPIPFGAGIVFYINFLIFGLLLLPSMTPSMAEKLIVLLCLGGLIIVVSFIDDLDTIYKFDRNSKSDVKRTAEELQWTRKKTPFEIPAKFRLALQIFVGAMIGLTSIKIGYVSNIFGGILQLEEYFVQLGDLKVYIVPLIFTIIWYVTVFNAINWSDGIPGLAPGIVAISLLVIAVLTVRFYITDATPLLRENSVFVFSILSIMIPASLVAWYYSLTPKFLIGDSGTMFASFIIASLALLVGGKVATVATVLGVYLIDAFYVICARLYNGQNPLKWDRIHHLHYRLLNMGLSESFVRNFVYILSFLFGISAAFLDRIGKIILFVVLAIIVVFITKILSLKSR